jgi:hypothetical protein
MVVKTAIFSSASAAAAAAKFDDAEKMTSITTLQTGGVFLLQEHIPFCMTSYIM